jgi:hypothetical protein
MGKYFGARSISVEWDYGIVQRGVRLPSGPHNLEVSTFDFTEDMPLGLKVLRFE